MITVSGRFLVSTLAVWVAASAVVSTKGSAVRGHSERSLTTSFIDFASFSPGDVVTTITSGVNVTALKRTSNGSLEAGDAMIFDTSAPSGQDLDLGTPHFMYGGPGVGEGGNRKSLFPNSLPQGKVLILSTDGNSADPDDHYNGGFLTFTFDPPLNISAIGLLDNEEGVHFEITTADGGSAVVIDNQGGNNSFQSVAIGKPNVVKIVVNLLGSGAISFITTGIQPCVPMPLFDLEAYSAGDWVTSLGTGITVSGNKTGELPGAAMIFNTSNPTGGDYDLGTPHKSFGGPGRGKDGKMGMPFANSESLGNVLILSADGNVTAPNDAAGGGDITLTFSPPTWIDSVGVLDNESGFILEVSTADGGESTFVNFNGGNNSFERMMLSLPAVVELKIRLLGSGAVTAVNGGACM